ncbi:GNAT family N-acetyltransferase [Paenibacillus shirakamiensis]|nr:GNAT family N-acetyltransferase [Paenibacillus shirakamiensis]
MTALQAKEICGWIYEPPYDIYGWLPWEEMQALDIEFGDPDIRMKQYISILSTEGELCGFSQIFPLQGVLRLGLGMKPDWCGRGMGKNFVQTVTQEARRRNPHAEIDLEVSTWNERAIRVYEKAGFQITDSYELRTAEGLKSFYCMVYQP